MTLSKFFPRAWPLSASLCVLALLAGSAPARAEDSGTRIGVINPNKVLTSMQETKDMRKKLEGDSQALETENKNRQAELTRLKVERDMLKADSPNFAGKNKEYLQRVIEYRVWYEMQNMDLARKQKMELKGLYDKIEAACAEVAATRRLDLVIVEQKPDLPADLDAVEPNALRNLLSVRNILYKGERVDISEAVIANLDSKYSGRGGGR